MQRPLLITAGATRNPIDAMRYISAHASGNTGLWLATQLFSHFDVHVLGSALTLSKAPQHISTEEFHSTTDLLERMRQWLEAHPHGVVIHSAAVGDFQMQKEHTGKITSGSSITLTLYPTPKILDQIKRWAPETFLVSFKAAAPESSIDELCSIAMAQLQRTTSDLVFANTIGQIEQQCILIERDRTQVYSRREDALHTLCRSIISQQ